MIDLPFLIAGSVAGIGVLTFVGMGIAKRMQKNQKDVIDAEGFEDKLHSIFTQPTKSQGSKINDWVKIRGVSNTPRTIGLAYRAKKMDVDIVEYNKDGSTESVKSEGTEYLIIEGTKGLSMKFKKLLTSLGFSKYFETYDVPQQFITAGDNYIWFDNQCHFVKFNGVKRHISKEGLSRGWDAAFSKIHENYLEAAGDIPEQYSVLNQRVSGQLKIENMKSENFRKFEKLKNQMDKMDAMDS